MNRNIPQISIANVMTFTQEGIPESEQFEISAIIDTADEITPLGRITFEHPDDLISLRNILDTFIRINDLDDPDEEEDYDDTTDTDTTDTDDTDDTADTDNQ